MRFNGLDSPFQDQPAHIIGSPYILFILRHASQHITLLFLVGLQIHISIQIFQEGQKIMSPSLMPPEWMVQIVGFIATNNGSTCQEHRFCCSNFLLLGRPAHDCRVLKQQTFFRPCAIVVVQKWNGSLVHVDCMIQIHVCNFLPHIIHELN